ncbi:hypothetical protein [Celeribacter halophilus]|uniref:hypothetical protein n=1 Tax=Celeribacter halophilus TaxID=576117 RepID=UPI003A8DD795
MRKIFWFFILAICGQPVLSGPDETTNFLIADTASMMDIGILRLNLELQSNSLGYASYKWDENRIKITAPYQNLNGPYDSEEAAEEACSKWVAELRQELWVDPETGKPFLGGTSIASDFFQHQGYHKTNTPETLYEDIDKLIIFECYARYSENVVTITGSLVAKGYSVAKD